MKERLREREFKTSSRSLNYDEFILTIDVGTTNIRAFLFDRSATIVSKAQESILLEFPNPGWIEQDPIFFWDQCKLVIRRTIEMAKIELSQVKAIGITNQRSSFLTWERKSGKPLHNIISWQDVRAEELSQATNTSFYVRAIQLFSKLLHFFTGIERYAAGSSFCFSTVQACIRLSWVLKNIEKVKVALSEGNLLFGTVDSWILWNMTEGGVHATDYSNISATGLWDPFIMSWNRIACSILEIPLSILPEVLDTSGHFGTCNMSLFFEEKNAHEPLPSIPITAICADQQAALFGQCCFEKGEAKISVGTGCFVNMNTGSQPYSSKHGLYPLIGWKIGEEVAFIVEGNDRNAGSILEWIKELGILDNVESSESMAFSISDTNGVYFIPAFSGLGHPYHNDKVKGALLGLRRDSKREHIARSVLEGIAFRINELVHTVMEDVPIRMISICIDGGVSNNNFLVEFVSNLIPVKIRRARHVEMSSQGVAFLAGLAIGFWKNKDALKSLNYSGGSFEPDSDIMSPEQRKRHLNNWKTVLKNHLASTSYTTTITNTTTTVVVVVLVIVALVVATATII